MGYACYLEQQFPSNPSLFGGAIGRGTARHINVWSDTQPLDARSILGPTSFRITWDSRESGRLDCKQRDSSSPFSNGGTLSHDLLWTAEARPLEYLKCGEVRVSRCRAANVRLHGKRALEWRASLLKGRQLALRISTGSF